MKRYSLLFLISLLSMKSYSQIKFGFDVGFMTSNMAKLDFIFGKSDNLFLIGLASSMNKGLNGEYYSNINWDEFPQDIMSEDHYYDLWNFGYKHIFKEKVALGVFFGYGEKVLFRNCYDDLHILGDNGYYHKIRRSGIKVFNPGIDVSYVYQPSQFGLIAGISYGAFSKAGLSIGMLLNL